MSYYDFTDPDPRPVEPLHLKCRCCRISFEEPDGVHRDLCITCEVRGCRRDGEWPRCYEGMPPCPRCGRRDGVEPCTHPSGETMFHCNHCGEGRVFTKEELQP